LPYSPVSSGESIRRSGLAWSAGVAFFGSVAFTLFLGWLADLLLGTSPWGIVGGIVLGSIIGFLQFFRITSRIFSAKGDTPAISPLMSSQDDDNV
jgi:F0F1-type ATP synthase assembly protein I